MTVAVQHWWESTVDRPRSGADLAPDTATCWRALWTSSHCEQIVAQQLAAKRFHVLLPRISVWRRRGGSRRLVETPMFPGYLFLNHPVDKATYVEVLKTRGLVRILGSRWDHLAQIPNAEIEAIQRVMDARMPIQPHAYLREGQRVRITDGPLEDVEGILIQQRPDKGLLVLSVDMLQRSVAVQVDCTRVTSA